MAIPIEDVKEPQTQISRQREIQQEHLAQLEKICSTLKEGLILVSTQPLPTVAEKEEEETLVLIAEELKENNRRISFVVSELEGMVYRLEL